jgi:chromate reductase
MNGPVRILGIAGSLRRASYNRAALAAAQQLVPSDATLERFDLDGIPGFNQDDEQHPPAKIVELKAKVRAADAILFVTPEYNYSVPGVLKNAIDWASRPARRSVLAKKPTAIFGASIASTGSARAQSQLRQDLVFSDVPVLVQPEILVYRAREKFDAELRLTDEKTREYIGKLLVALADWTRRLTRPL